ncbi:MAG TPA: DUF4139 domain-containing protein [Gemmatimonadota bacterium]|nr:DUF4139 domain-containing protein [Gemmatimonadota bacterium]
MRCKWNLVVALLVATAARAQTPVTPADRTALDLTVYAGFAQVRDSRRADLPGGGEIVWTGVPLTIDPGTILLAADGDPLGFRAEIPRPERFASGPVLGRHLGETVILVSPAGERSGATLVSADGPVFLRGGQLIVGWQGHIEVPAGLADENGTAGTGGAIRLSIDGPSGPATLALSYLMDGLSWSADYVALLDDDGSAMRLSGRVTVENESELAFPEAALALVAGDVRRTGQARPLPSQARVAEMAVGADFEREALGDYHLYTLDAPLTIGSLATVQAPLFGVERVPVVREYVLAGQRFWFHQPFPPERRPFENPEIRLRFANQDLAGSGEPLPAGTLHTYVESGGRLRFTGDAPIPHTPDGERIEVVTGFAFDLVAERTQTDYRQLDPNTHESAWRIEIRNRGREDRTVTVIEPLPGDWTIVEESLLHERIDAHTVRWEVPVPAGGESVLTYRVRATE